MLRVGATRNVTINVTSDLVRKLGDWARRADAGLARTAAENAAHSMDAARARDLEDARTLRDLERIPQPSPQQARTSR